jgi:hypothetical protein
LTRILYIAYFLEVGLILLLVPWIGFWDRNYFAEAMPFVHAVIQNNYVRGAVSGVGLLNILAGLIELRDYLRQRRHGE